MTKCICYILFLLDSTTRSSDLPLNVIVQSGYSQAKVVLQMAQPLFGVKWKSPQTSLIDSHVKSIFSQNRAVFENLDSYIDHCQFIFISTPTKRRFFQRANRVVTLNVSHLDRM